MYYNYEEYKDHVIDFLADHQQAWEDCCRYFGADPDDEYALDSVNPSDLEDWVWDHDQLYADLEAYLARCIEADNKEASDILGDEYDMYKDYVEGISIASAVKEAMELDEGKEPPIRKVLEANDIMATLDRDPQGTLEKAIQLVKESDEISEKDKYTFAQAVGTGPISKRVSSLASYFYDVQRVGKRR